MGVYPKSNVISTSNWFWALWRRYYVTALEYILYRISSNRWFPRETFIGKGEGICCFCLWRDFPSHSGELHLGTRTAVLCCPCALSRMRNKASLREVSIFPERDSCPSSSLSFFVHHVLMLLGRARSKQLDLLCFVWCFWRLLPFVFFLPLSD